MQEYVMTQTYTLSVPDMSCGGCRASIDKVLAPMGAQTQFDMTQRRVTVTGDPAPEAAISALDRIGFAAARV